MPRIFWAVGNRLPTRETSWKNPSSRMNLREGSTRYLAGSTGNRRNHLLRTLLPSYSPTNLIRDDPRLNWRNRALPNGCLLGEGNCLPKCRRGGGSTPVWLRKRFSLVVMQCRTSLWHQVCVKLWVWQRN